MKQVARILDWLVVKDFIHVDYPHIREKIKLWIIRSHDYFLVG